MYSGNMKLMRILPPIAMAVIALLWITDVINQSTFLILLVIETAASMLLTIYFAKRQRDLENTPQDFQTRIDATQRSDSTPE